MIEITESQLLAVIDIAKEAHKGQTRWDKKTPYFEGHLEKVAKAMEVISFATNIELEVGPRLLQGIAYLHDIIEDTDFSLYVLDQKLLQGGIYPLERQQLSIGVEALTHKEFQTYLEYIKSICDCGLTHVKIIKLCDIYCNLNDLRKEDPERYSKHIQRYELAAELIRQSL